MSGIILTSPQCGGTHAYINLLKGLGLRLTARHRDGIWYLSGLDKRTQKSFSIGDDFDFGLNSDEFATGHSGPFPTDLKVICNLRDPRNIILCHWNRRGRLSHPSLLRFLISRDAVKRCLIIPRHWEWEGGNVLRVWYEDILKEATQRRIAEFCSIDWKQTDFYGHSKTWSGRPSDWRQAFDGDCRLTWSRLWRDVTDQRWEDWWAVNGRLV